jgi:hypothetical protein
LATAVGSFSESIGFLSLWLQTKGARYITDGYTTIPRPVLRVKSSPTKDSQMWT